MKRILLFLFLAVAGTTHAQIVNIPDANFKAALTDPDEYIAKDSTGQLIMVDTNGDGEIQVVEAQAIWSLFLADLPISSLQGIEAFTNLRSLQVFETNITSLDLTGLTYLEYLDCTENHLTSLNISGLANLTSINCDDNQISSVMDFTGMPLLTSIDCSENHIPSVILGDKPYLTQLRCSDNQISSIDISGCPVITLLDASNNPLGYLNIKNGNVNPCGYYLSSDSIEHLYVCIDEGEQENIQQALNGIDNQLSTYCTFTPGGGYNVITGSLSFDDEGDGCDPNDSVISNIKIDMTGTDNSSALSNTGVYNFYTQSGTFIVTPNFNNDLFTISPPFAEVNFTEVDGLVTTQSFCLTANGNHPNLDIVIVPYSVQPGFDAIYRVVYTNKGNQSLSGAISFNYQEDVLDFVSANPAADSSAPGTLTWNYTNLEPFQHRDIYVVLNVNGPMETPPVNIDDVLAFTASVTPLSGDETPGDNSFELNQVITGSFDPNNISCLEGDSVNPDKIGEYLHYNINFENTGTAPATFITIEDSIDLAQFDISSLQLIDASHEMQARIIDNKVVFRFEGINLGPQEKGNVTFKIKSLNTLQANDDVTQQANIFFDYNFPIETNEATTTFEVLSRGDFAIDNSVKVYPNPSNGIVNIKAASEIRSAELYDVQGRLLQVGNTSMLDISQRARGLYFVKILTDAGIKAQKLIKE